jgi:hypothetical protein
MCSPPQRYCRECSHAGFDGAAVVNGKRWAWEFSPRFGPLYLRKDGEPMERQPSEKHPVWDAFDKWFKKWDKVHPPYKKRKKLAMKYSTVASVLLLALVLASSGCGSMSRGSLTLVDIDLRTPEQILADKEQAPAVAREPAEWYDFIIKAISVIKGRIRVLSVDWDVLK